jgi:hypothetical protein
MSYYSTPKSAIETLKGYEQDEPIIWDSVHFDEFADDELTKDDWREVCSRINNTCDMLLDDHLIKNIINEVIDKRKEG